MVCEFFTVIDLPVVAIDNHQLPVTVPDQLSVVGFDSIGQQAMQSLLHLLRGERVIRRQTPSSHLIVRKSTGRISV